MHLLYSIQILHEQEFEFISNNFIDMLYGSDKLRLFILNNKSVDELIDSWSISKQQNEFLLY